MALTKVPNELLSDPHIGVGITDTATSAKLAVSNTGIDVTGSVTSDSSVVDGYTDWRVSGAVKGNIFADSSTMIINTQGTNTTLNTNGGNVGIGTNSIDGTLHVDGGTNSDIIIEKDGGGGASLRFHNDGSQISYIQLDASEDMIHYGASGVNQIIYAGGGERMRIDTAGQVTMPYQPSFCASTSGAGKNSAGIIDIWDTVHTNIGNNFSSGGLFTAPITGVYFFTAGIMSTTTHSHFTFYKNGSATNGYFHSASVSGAAYNRTSGTAYIYLVANDTVGVGSTSSTYTYGTAGSTAWSQFSGHLIG